MDKEYDAAENGGRKEQTSFLREWETEKSYNQYNTHKERKANTMNKKDAIIHMIDQMDDDNPLIDKLYSFVKRMYRKGAR